MQPNPTSKSPLRTVAETAIEEEDRVEEDGVDTGQDGQHILCNLLSVIREVYARGLDVEEPAPVGEDH